MQSSFERRRDESRRRETPGIGVLTASSPSEETVERVSTTGKVGLDDGCDEALGKKDGSKVGSKLGCNDGIPLALGICEGVVDGETLGKKDGSKVGSKLGCDDGIPLAVGIFEGVVVGSSVQIGKYGNLWQSFFCAFDLFPAAVS